MTDSPSALQALPAGLAAGAAMGMVLAAIRMGVVMDNPEERAEGWVLLRSLKTGKVVRMVRVG